MRLNKTVAALAAGLTLGTGAIVGIVPAEAAAKSDATVAKIAQGPVVGLGYGRRNAHVKRLQKALTAAGYTVPATGYYGKITLRQVKAYQKAHGLPVTGYTASMTWGSLQGKATTKKPAAPAKKAAAPAPAKRTTTAPKQAAQNTSPAVGSSCQASFYWQGQMTASGERFNPNDMTAAHKTLPLGSRVKVTNPKTGATVTVRINDRGPYIGGRCLDLSRAAFAAIGDTNQGVMNVNYQVL